MSSLNILQGAVNGLDIVSTNGQTSSDAIKRPVEEYRTRGRELFRNGNFEAAAEVYKEAVDYYRSDAVLLNNLSLCYARMSEWSSARFYAFLSTYLDPKSEKAGYSLARAFRMLGKLEDMIGVVDGMLLRQDMKRNLRKELEQWKREAQEKLKTCKQGVYPLKQMVLASANGEHLVYPDYLGLVEVKEVPGRGRGLICTKDVQTGTLLFVERALTTVHGTTSNLGALGQQNNTQMPGSLLLANKVVQLAEWDFDLRAKVNKLQPGVDWMAPDPQSHDYGIKRLKQAAIFNRIACPNPTGDGSILFMLFYMLSFCNHSCVPNAVPQFVGDFVFFRAVTAIQKGKEVLRDYFTATSNPQERAEKLRSGLGFECTCDLCQLYKEQPSVLATRIAAATALQNNSLGTNAVSLADQLVEQGGGLLSNQQLEEVLSAALAQEKGMNIGKPSQLELELRKRHCEALDGYFHPICVQMACLSWLELKDFHPKAAEEFEVYTKYLAKKYYGDQMLGVDMEFIGALSKGQAGMQAQI